MEKNKVRLIIGVICITGIALLSWSMASTLAKQDYNALGLAEHEAGNFNKAIEYYTKVIELNPENADAYANLAQVYELLNQTENARTTIKKALEIKNNHIGALLALAKLEKREKNYICRY